MTDSSNPHTFTQADGKGAMPADYPPGHPKHNDVKALADLIHDRIRWANWVDCTARRDDPHGTSVADLELDDITLRLVKAVRPDPEMIAGRCDHCLSLMMHTEKAGQNYAAVGEGQRDL